MPDNPMPENPISETALPRSTPRPRTGRRIAVATGAAGLVAGLALGVTGLASAAGTPTPSAPSGATGGQDVGATGPQDRGARGPGFGHRGHGGPGRHGGRGGLLTAVSAGSLTVDTRDGVKTVTTNAATKYFQGATASTHAVLAAGEIVAVRLVDRTASNPVAAAVVVLPAHVEGWVASVGEGSFTLTDPAGFTRTVTTSAATTYRKDGATGSAAELVKGAFVRASGTVAADGTTLVAGMVATGHPERPTAPPAAGAQGGDFAPPADAPVGGDTA